MIVDHLKYLATQKRLKSALDNFKPGHMVFLIGPSGVGKTTLRHSVMQKMFGNPMKWGRGRIPAIETFAMLPHGAYFSSRELAKALAKELHVPTLDWLFDGNDIDKAIEDLIRMEIAQCALIWDQLKRRVATESDYWDSFTQSLPVRGCKYVSIDQVTALLVNRRDTSPTFHTIQLMNIAEASKIMFIMTGIYSATRLWAIHAELRRRVIPIWMPPYSEKRNEDQLPYLQLLKTFSTKYAYSKSDLLLTMSNDILAATGGVFAEINQLLGRAAERARVEGVAHVHKRHIESSYYNDEDLKTLWCDIEAFELAMEPGSVSERSQIIAARWKLPAAKSMGQP